MCTSLSIKLIRRLQNIKILLVVVLVILNIQIIFRIYYSYIYEINEVFNETITVFNSSRFEKPIFKLALGKDLINNLK